MFLDRKPFIYIWRPFYRLVFGGIIHPLTMKLWTHIIQQPLPPSPPENSLAARFQEIDRLKELIERMDAAHAESKREWMATESLMLALIHESEQQPATSRMHDGGDQRR